MNEIFTAEEVNLMCFYDTSGREIIISELTDLVSCVDTGDPQSDSEIREIAAGALSKLADMSDAEFAAISLYPAYDEDDDTTEE